MQNTKLDAISAEVVQSIAIEDDWLAPESVHSAIARRLRMEAGACRRAEEPLDRERLYQ